MKDQGFNKTRPYPTIVKLWLCIGLFMLIMQVVIGGITRLTGSGLSITKWEIVTGTLPPLNNDAWKNEFDLYKDTPQYQKLNEGMSLDDFKFIYFWEYFHRLWARAMGLVFLIPFIIFWRLKYIDVALMRRLGTVVLLAAVVAVFGWIMVASGLVDRPWVNAYKLTLHLSLALMVFSYLLWTTFYAFNIKPADVSLISKFRKANIFLLVLLCMQIIFGGLMSGMHAALVFPTWPMMHDSFIPGLLFEKENWKIAHFFDYDKHPFMPALVQVFHRMTGYFVYIFGMWFGFKLYRKASSFNLKIGTVLFLIFLNVQVVLGILTLINSKGMVPVGLGVVHQGVALFVLAACLFLLYHFRKRRITTE